MATIQLEQVVHGGEKRIAVRFAYDSAMIKLVKKVPGHRWSETLKCWHVPYNHQSFEQLKALFGEEALSYAGKTSTKQQPATPDAKTNTYKAPEPALEKAPPAKVEPVKATIRLAHHEKHYKLHMPKVEADVQFVKGILYNKWLDKERCWRIPVYGDNLDRIRKYFGNRMEETKENLPPAAAKPAMPAAGICQCIQMANGRVSVLAGYHEGLVKFLKQQPLHAYDSTKKQWTIAWYETVQAAFEEFTQQNGLTLKWEIAAGKSGGKPRPLFKQMQAYKPVPDAYVNKLKELNYGENTIRNYSMHFEEFINCHPGHDAADITPQMIEAHMQYLVNERQFGVSSHKGAISAIKFYYERVLKQPKYTYQFEQPRNEKKLPKVLSKEEMKIILEQANNIKHEFLLKLTYGTGIRLEEVINLEWIDMNIDRKTALIRDAKFNNDRYVPLPKKVLELIPAYREEEKPLKYVVEPEHKAGKQLSERTAQEVFAYCLKKSGIEKPASFHTMRHCFATHALESGVSLRVIQQILGHKSIKTTEIYTHVTQKTLEEFRSPLDDL